MKNIIPQPSIVVLIFLLFLGSVVGVVIGNHQINSNKSELLDSMNPKAKVQLISDTERLNKLITNLKKAEFDTNSNLLRDRQEISKSYLSLAKILADDLRNIQITNPRIAANTRLTIDTLRRLSVDIMKEGFYPSYFQP
jgi:uncharacterized protein YpmS